MKRAPKVVFIRTGWMVWYDYARERKRPQGGGAFNERGAGSEVNNFHAHKDRLYGYVQTPGGGFNLGRIQPGADGTLDDVLVLAYTTIPGRVGQHLVGWYRGARCEGAYWNRPGGLYGAWNFEAPAQRAVLLPLPERIRAAPSRYEGGFGQANVRYAYDDEGNLALLPWMAEAISFVRRYRGANLLAGADPGKISEGATGRQGWLSDPVANKAVEMHAMALAARFFRAKGYEVDTEVHRYRPYDLLCRKGSGQTLRVEVKGTTEAAESVMLTMGEVRSARAGEAPTALFVVSEIQLSANGKGWRTRGGKAGWIPRWIPAERHLEPTAYTYRLPPLRGITR